MIKNKKKLKYHRENEVMIGEKGKYIDELF